MKQRLKRNCGRLLQVSGQAPRPQVGPSAILAAKAWYSETLSRIPGNQDIQEFQNSSDSFFACLEWLSS